MSHFGITAKRINMKVMGKRNENEMVGESGNYEMETVNVECINVSQTPSPMMVAN